MKLYAVAIIAVADIDLKKGQLTHAGPYGTQSVIAKNNTGQPLGAVSLTCGFFRGDLLLSVGQGIALNVAIDETVYVDVISSEAGNADRAECRVAQIKR
jgi:hypothetical protein